MFVLLHILGGLENTNSRVPCHTKETAWFWLNDRLCVSCFVLIKKEFRKKIGSSLTAAAGSEILNTVVSLLSWNERPGYFDRFVLYCIYTPLTVPQMLSKMQSFTPTHSLPSRASFMIHFCKLSLCRAPIWHLERLPCSPRAGRNVHLIVTEEKVQGHPQFSLQWNEDIVHSIYSPFSIFTKALFCYLMRSDAFFLAQSKQKWAQTATCDSYDVEIFGISRQAVQILSGSCSDTSYHLPGFLSHWALLQAPLLISQVSYILQCTGRPLTFTFPNY